MRSFRVSGIHVARDASNVLNVLEPLEQARRVEKSSLKTCADRALLCYVRGIRLPPSQVPYSHGISLIVATKFPDATNKGKLKAAMKYGALFGKNTAKDKWAAPESKKHSSLTKNKDKIGKQSLQGLVLLTPEQEADLELDPEKGFSFGEVEGDLEKGQIEGEEMTAKIQAEKNEELAAIIRTDGKMEEIDDVTDIADLGSVLKTAIGRKHDEKDAAAGKPVVKRSQSAVWGLAKKSMAATKGVVAEGDRDAEVIDDAEFERLQNA